MQVLFFIIGVFLQWTLEVLGAGGAIWGMSEVWHVRGDTNDDAYGSNDSLRIHANIVFVLGFIRMFFRYSQNTSLKMAIVDPQDWLKSRFGDQDTLTVIAEFLGFILGFFLQWVLEVLGAGGATWGMSEVWKLRGPRTADGPQTNHDFRWVANVVFTIGVFRMAQKYCPPHGVHVAMNAPHDWVKSLNVEQPTEDVAGAADDAGAANTELQSM